MPQCWALGPFSPLLSAGRDSSSFLSSFPTVGSRSHLSSARLHNSNLPSPAISSSRLLLPPLPVSRIASPAGQCLCLPLICPSSIVALKIFPPLLCLSTISTTPQPTHSPLLIPSHYSTSEYVQDHNSALGKAGSWPGKDKEPKIQDSSLWNHLVACQQGKSKVFLLTNSNL